MSRYLFVDGSIAFLLSSNSSSLSLAKAQSTERPFVHYSSLKVSSILFSVELAQIIFVVDLNDVLIINYASCWYCDLVTLGKSYPREVYSFTFEFCG